VNKVHHRNIKVHFLVKYKFLDPINTRQMEHIEIVAK